MAFKDSVCDSGSCVTLGSDALHINRLWLRVCRYNVMAACPLPLSRRLMAAAMRYGKRSGVQVKAGIPWTASYHAPREAYYLPRLRQDEATAPSSLKILFFKPRL